MKQLPILEKRKIQAEVLGPVFREMVEQVGSEKAASILKEAIRKAAIEEGKHFREKADASLSAIENFVALMEGADCCTFRYTLDSENKDKNL